jgi:serine/threonine protein kinase
LVAHPIPDAETLSTYVEHQGAMSPEQVRQVLLQILQSLRYLHSTYQVRWLENKSKRGLVHGNLNLDSLWLRWDQLAAGRRDRQFFVYLSRFAFWEHLCWPADGDYPIHKIAADPQDLGSVTQDLADLGRLSFILLTGKAPNPLTGKMRHPQREEDWPKTPEALALRPFIWRLMGYGPESQFKSADVALSVLQNSPTSVPLPVPTSTSKSEAQESSGAPPTSKWFWLGLGTTGAVSLLAIFGLLNLINSPESNDNGSPSCENCLVSGIFSQGSHKLAYDIEPNSSWASAFFHYIAEPGLPTNAASSSPLQSLLADRANIKLEQQSALRTTNTSLINRVQSNQLHFALMQAVDDEIEEMEAGVAAEVVAYDGIVPFVVFSDANREESIPKLLSGEISLKQLGDLFAGRTTTIEEKPVRLYFPEDDATADRLRTQLKEHNLLSEADAANFNRLRQEDNERRASTDGRDNIYERMLVDFEAQQENTEIGIGFDRLSRLIGQCSVYPLAVQHEGRRNSVLIQSDGKPISPETDLCGDKGAYWANSYIFSNGRYPLGYGLSVVYPTCADDTICQGKTFATMLKTDEGQFLLSQVGLVPMQPVRHLRRVLWVTHE